MNVKLGQYSQIKIVCQFLNAFNQSEFVIPAKDCEFAQFGRFLFVEAPLVYGGISVQTA